MFRRLIEDAREGARTAEKRSPTLKDVLRHVAVSDSFHINALTRIRELSRALHVPIVNRVLRLTQTALYGVEIGKDVKLGRGVYFVHTAGTVIGGDAQVGDRVILMGNNTIGTAKDNGYPVIEDDVVIGVGARILGPIRIGTGAVIGANAVVLTDVPAGAVAVGIPAKIVERTAEAAATALFAEDAA